ncbi:glutathionylspermidine synthase family protein [Brevibacillus migulae]|uniref:glutathionylspermidine synthase family protein n=1 Tax=Brevibacillus migulae TaxID=1644114 RepID=UPI0038B388F7
MRKEEYRERREHIYRPLREAGIFTWDYLYEEEYALADIHLIPSALRHEIAAATAQLGRIFQRVVPVLQQADDRLLHELGIPEEAWGAVRLRSKLSYPTVIGRFDFAQTLEGLKMLEFNSDTPTGIVEAFYVNEHLCRYYGVKNPNQGHEHDLHQAFQQAVEEYKKANIPTEHVVFSSLDWHEEDAGTTRYLLENSGLEGRFVPLADLRVWQDRLYAKVGEELIPVDLLYRLHALEKLAAEQDEEGYPTGAHVLDLIARRRLTVINPPTGFLMQTKALQALIWSLHEEGQFWSEEEHAIIDAYMLPTYFENRFAGSTAYVTKPIFGREGGGVTLYSQEGETIARDMEQEYWEQPMIYQQLVKLPQVSVHTLKGRYEGHLLWGSFLLGGKPSAIIARVGGKITSNLSYYLPIGLIPNE